MRPAGAKLLSDAREGKFNLVLVWKLDRLARKPSITLNTIETLESYGIGVRSITEALDASTPAGRLMRNMLASFAGFERDSIVERSIEGTNRRAKDGQWLGGIVPYGYEVVGKKKDARLVVSEKIISNHSLSESDVVRMIYRKLAKEKESCVKIADELNALGIPPAYVKDNRQLQIATIEGKRKVNTAGIWRPARIRNLAVNPVYKGIHVYGKRSRKQRELIPRTVAAIVSEQDWEKAQEMLKANRCLSDRNATEKYLLRGLVKCGLCGLTYTGCTYHTSQGGRKRYYRCNGKTAYRGPFQGECQAKAVQADALEEAVWREIEKILLNRDVTLERLNQKYLDQEKWLAVSEAERALVEKSLTSKKAEREKILDLYRHQLISISDTESQLVKIAAEEKSLSVRLDEIKASAREQERIEEKLNKAGELIQKLQNVLKNPLPWEAKREIVEQLVWEVRVDTVTHDNKRKAEIGLAFAFGENMLSVNRTGRGSSPPPA
jgi:site-specific DNA recombinase